MEALTELALARRWAPQVFVRLCGQLRSTQELAEGAGAVVAAAACDKVPDPLALEYVLALSTDPDSVLPLSCLLQQWSGEQWEERSAPMAKLMAYVARGLDHCRFSRDDAKAVTSAIDELITQAIEGCPESRFFISKFLKAPIAANLASACPEWSFRLEKTLRQCPEFAPYCTILQSDVLGSESGLEKLEYNPCRAFWLIWLDRLVIGLYYVDTNRMLKQLEVLWPSQRFGSVAYELGITAFTGIAAATQAPASGALVQRWKAFITKRLPQILEAMSKSSVWSDPEQQGALEAVVSRVLTTMSKELAAVADSLDIRAEFGRVCIDMGLCDAAVLHTLHKAHSPRPDNTVRLIGLPICELAAALVSREGMMSQVIQVFTNLGARGQAQVAAIILETVLKPPELKVQPKLPGQLAVALMRSPEAADELFLHIDVHTVAAALLRHADAVAHSPVKQIKDYQHIGAILSFIGGIVMRRYGRGCGMLTMLVGPKSWSLSQVLMDAGRLRTAAELDHSQTMLLGRWITTLFRDHAFNNENLSSVADLRNVLPALVTQVAEAYTRGLLSSEALHRGVRLFAQPGLASHAPLVFRALAHSLWEQRNVPAIVEILRILLRALALVKDDIYAASACCSIVSSARQILTLAPEASSLKPDVDVFGFAPEFIGTYGEGCEVPVPTSIRSALQSSAEELMSWLRHAQSYPVLRTDVWALASRLLPPQERVAACMQAYSQESGTSDANSIAMDVTVALITLSCGFLFDTNDDSFSRTIQSHFNDHRNGNSSSLKEVIANAQLYIEKLRSVQQPDVDILGSLDVVASASPENPSQGSNQDNNRALDSIMDDGDFLDLDAPMGLADLDSAMTSNLWE